MRIMYKDGRMMGVCRWVYFESGPSPVPRIVDPGPLRAPGSQRVDSSCADRGSKRARPAKAFSGRQARSLRFVLCSPEFALFFLQIQQSGSAAAPTAMLAANASIAIAVLPSPSATSAAWSETVSAKSRLGKGMRSRVARRRRRADRRLHRSTM
jgi:hypothetical protein